MRPTLCKALHIRRKFHEALQNDQPRAEYALALFRQLYAIERKIKDQALTGDAVVQLRQQEAMPVVQTLKNWMETEYPAIIVKKRPIAQAMGYFLPRWEKLCIYTQDARRNIDNNLGENAIRPVAVGKKITSLPGVMKQRSALQWCIHCSPPVNCITSIPITG